MTARTSKKIISLEVTSEEVHHDGKKLSKLVDNSSFAENNHVNDILANGTYDSNNNFRYLSKHHIEPGIKTRSNSKVRSTANCLRMPRQGNPLALARGGIAATDNNKS